MGKKVPRITAAELIKVLEKLGFEFIRSSGSHRIYKKKGETTKRIVLPFHSGKIIHPKIIKDILKITNLTSESLLELL